MKSLEQDINNVLLGHTFSVGDIIVSEPYPYKAPDLSIPTIVVQEINNQPYEERETRVETASRLTYQISVIARATLVGENVLSPYQVVTNLSMEVCDLLREELLLTRVGDFVTRPYSSDNTVMERVFRVTGVLDLEHDIIYRR